MASHVFIRVDQVKTPLQNPYERPFPVVSRDEKTYVVRVRGKDTHVSIERLKPAYILENNHDGYNDTHEEVRLRITREPAIRDTQVYTRSGRRVRFPDRLQGS